MSRQPQIFAGVFRRAVAHLLDRVLTIAVSVALVLALGGADPGMDGLGSLGIGGALLIMLLYAPIMESSRWQATLGKIAMNAKVVNAEGERIGFWRAMARHLMAFFSSFLMIGYAMAAFTERRQTLHDRVSDSLVVMRSADAASVRTAKPLDTDVGGIVMMIILVISVPMVGILAAVAIPAYQDYTNKAKVAEAYQQSQEAARMISAYYARNQALPLTVQEAGFTPTSQYIASMDIDDAGLLTTQVKLGTTQKARLFLAAQPAGDSPVAGLRWTCKGDGAAPIVFPAACRQNAEPR